MAAIPPAEFERRLRSLSHEETVAVVARLWAGSGWETTVDESVVLATKAARRERLLVVAPSRVPTLRSVSPPEEPIDCVVVPWDGDRGLPRRLPDAPVLDAEVLRRRLLYALEPAAARELSLEHLGVPARSERWNDDGAAETPGSAFASLRPDEPPVSRRATLGLLGLGTLAGAALVTRHRRASESTDPGLDGPAPTPDTGEEADDDTPSLEFSFEEPDQLSIRHAGGEAFDPADATIRGSGFAGEPAVRWRDATEADANSPVEPGDELTLTLRPDGEVTVVLSENDEERTIGEFEGPAAPDGLAVPELAFAFSYDEDEETLQIEYTGEEAVDADALLLSGAGFTGEPERRWWDAAGADADTAVEPGDELRIDADPTVTVALSWETEWEDERVAQFIGPARPLASSLDGFRSFGGGVDNAGYVTDEDAPTEEPVERWSVELEDEGVFASPAVADGIIYVAGSSGTLYALDATDGVELWRFEADAGFGRTTPAVATLPDSDSESVVYVGTQSHGGGVYALDAATGERRWGLTRLDRLTASVSVVVDGDQTPTVLAAGEEGPAWSLYALDPGDGSIRWRRAQELFRPISGISTPTVSGDTVYVGVDDGTVRALGLEDGTPRWQTAPAGDGIPVDTPPLLAESGLLVGTREGSVHALDPDDGGERWSTTVESELVLLPALGSVDEREILFVGDADGSLFALDATDGEERWRFEPDGTVNGSPVVVGGESPSVYVGSTAGSLHAVSATDGSERWTSSIGGEVAATPAVVGGTVYVANTEGEVRALVDPEQDETA